MLEHLSGITFYPSEKVMKHIAQSLHFDIISGVIAVELGMFTFCCLLQKQVQSKYMTKMKGKRATINKMTDILVLKIIISEAK